MLREEIFSPVKGGLTSARFTYLAEVAAMAFEPTQTQLEDLERAYNATGEYLVACPEFDGMLTQVHAQGSRQMGTIVRPMDSSREGFDIDLVVKLSSNSMTQYSGCQGASLLLKRLKSALTRYANSHGLEIEPWDRCVTLVYAGGMRADFVPIIEAPRRSVEHGEHHGFIPDRKLQNYVSTNPKGYCLGFEQIAKMQANFTSQIVLDSIANEAFKAELVPLPDAAEVLGGLMCRYVQLAKVHRNFSFTDVDAALVPTSVFLTSLIARGYQRLAPAPHDGPLELFVDIVDAMPSLFERHSLGNGREQWVLNNPFALNDNLADSMNASERQDAFGQWHERLKSDLKRLVLAINDTSNSDSVLEAVKKSFGPRASQAMLEHNAKHREVRRASGRANYFVSGAAAAVSSVSRSHTFFGDH